MSDNTSSNSETQKNSARTASSAREKARKMQKKQETADKRKSLIIRFSVVGIALAAIIALVLIITLREDTGESYSSGDAPSVANESGGIVLTSAQEIEEIPEEEQLGRVDIAELPSNFSPQGLVREDSDIPHIVSYSDPGCPGCAAFEAQHHTFLEEMLEAGAITLEYRLLSFQNEVTQGYSSRASNALVCMAEESPENFFDYAGNTIAAGDTISGEDLANIAENEYDVDISECVSDSQFRAFSAYTTNLAAQENVSVTPTVYVDGESWGDSDMPFPEFVQQQIQNRDSDTDGETEEILDEADDEEIDPDDIDFSETDED